MPILEILLYSSIFFFFYLMIMAVLFPRISIKYIDNKMIQDGISSPSWSEQVRHFTLWLFFVKGHENQHHYLMAAMLQSMQDQ